MHYTHARQKKDNPFVRLISRRHTHTHTHTLLIRVMHRALLLLLLLFYDDMP